MPTPAPVNLSVAIGLPPARAVEYFQAKGYAITRNWHDLWQEAHARAFTVAGAMRLDILQDIRGELQRGLNGDITEREFVRNLRPRLEALGWWGKQVQVDEATDEARLAQTGSPWRLKTIFRTNLQSAYMAGRYRQMIDNVADRPYWQYVAVMDAKTRPAHAAMNGLVFRYDDPFWQHFYPPNGFNCRCTVRALSEANLRERGIAVSESGQYLREAWAVESASGLTERIAIFKRPGMATAGRTDLGWNYNPGRAAWQPNLDAYDMSLARAYLADAIRGPAFDAFVAGTLKGEMPVAVLDAQYRQWIGAETQVVKLSSDTLAKNQAAHPEIALAQYRHLPDVIAEAQLVVKQGDLALVFVRRGEDIYMASVKATASGRATFVTSYRITSPKDVQRLKRTGAVLKDELDL